MTDTPAETPAPLPPPTLPPPAAPPVASAATEPPPGTAWVKWLVPAGLLVVALIVVLFVVIGGDDGPAGPPRGTSDAATAVAAIVDGADLSESTVAEIECPVDIGDILSLAPDTTDIASLDGEGAFSAVLEPDGSKVRLIECSFEANGAVTGVSLGVVAGRDTFEAAMDSYLPTHRLTFDEPRSWRGGTLFTYCGVPTEEASEDGFDEFCEADWVTDGLVIGVFGSPLLADEAQISAWLDAALIPMIDQLAD